MIACGRVWDSPQQNPVSPPRRGGRTPTPHCIHVGAALAAARFNRPIQPDGGIGPLPEVYANVGLGALTGPFSGNIAFDAGLYLMRPRAADSRPYENF